jgi:hypothetical protein
VPPFAATPDFIGKVGVPPFAASEAKLFGRIDAAISIAKCLAAHPLTFFRRKLPARIDAAASIAKFPAALSPVPQFLNRNACFLISTLFPRVLIIR